MRRLLAASLVLLSCKTPYDRIKDRVVPIGSNADYTEAYDDLTTAWRQSNLGYSADCLSYENVGILVADDSEFYRHSHVCPPPVDGSCSVSCAYGCATAYIIYMQDGSAIKAIIVVSERTPITPAIIHEGAHRIISCLGLAPFGDSSHSLVDVWGPAGVVERANGRPY